MDRERTESGMNLAQLLRIPFQMLVTELHERLAAAGFPDIRPPHSVIFAHLGPEGMRLTDLAERAQLTKQMVNYLIDTLEARGYVERVPDPTDRRAKLVRLTERGVHAARVGYEIIFSIEAEWAQRIGASAMADLRTRLEHLVAAL